MKKKAVVFMVTALTAVTLFGASCDVFEPAPAIGATFDTTMSSSVEKENREYLPIETKTAAGRDAEIRIYPDGKTRAVGVNDCTILTADNGTRYITDRNGSIYRNELVEIFGNKYVVKSDGAVASDELVSHLFNSVEATPLYGAVLFFFSHICVAYAIMDTYRENS